MYALVIGRAFPDEKTGMMGIFEFEQAVALKKAGLKTVYAFCDTRSIKSLRVYNRVNIQKEDVPVYGYHLPIGGIPTPVFDKIKSYKFKKVIKSIMNDHGKPKVIHVHFPLLCLNDGVLDFLKDLEVPLVVTEHWTKVQTKKLENYRIKLLKRIVEETKAFICVGDILKQSVKELTCTKKEIKVIPNMLNSGFVFKEIKNKTDEFKFITIGRLVDVKRFELTIDGFVEAFKDNEKITLDIVGDGPLYHNINNRIKEHNMQSRIKTHGFLAREKTADLLKKSDAYVSASVLETFGVPFIEALACGKPIIGIKNGPIDRYITKDNGILFEQDNIDELVISMQEIYDNYNMYNNESIAKETQELFGEKNVTNEIITVYREVMQ